MRAKKFPPMTPQQKRVIAHIATGDPYGNCNTSQETSGRACTIQSLARRGFVMAGTDQLTLRGRDVYDEIKGELSSIEADAYARRYEIMRNEKSRQERRKVASKV